MPRTLIKPNYSGPLDADDEETDEKDLVEIVAAQRPRQSDDRQSGRCCAEDRFRCAVEGTNELKIEHLIGGRGTQTIDVCRPDSMNPHTRIRRVLSLQT